MSCPQQPGTFGPMASFMGLVHLILGLPLLPLALFSELYCLSQETLTSHGMPEVGQLQFCHFSSSDVSGLICSRTYLFIYHIKIKRTITTVNVGGKREQQKRKTKSSLAEDSRNKLEIQAYIKNAE